MKTIYVVPIEPLDNRYTAQWFEEVPKTFRKYITEKKIDIEVISVPGDPSDQILSGGGFLDFIGTNCYKSSQIQKISELFKSDKVKDGDVFHFDDAWNYAIIATKYMAELTHKKVTVSCTWHAGSYDPSDILGFTIKDKEWSYAFERAIYHASDYNWFGTAYHRDMFLRNLDLEQFCNKAMVCGQPHQAIIDSAKQIPWMQKENIVLFPHRISLDKNPDIFRDLALAFPDYKFLFTQDLNLSKQDYYDLVRKAKLVVSFSNHENFGISIVEAIFNGTAVLVPNKLSYAEMYFDKFKYPAEWLVDYPKHKPELIEVISDVLRDSNYSNVDFTPDGQFSICRAVERNKQFLQRNFMTADKMIEMICA